MKIRILSALLALLILASVVGCSSGSNTDADTTKQTTAADPTTTAADDTQITEGDTAEAADTETTEADTTEEVVVVRPKLSHRDEIKMYIGNGGDRMLWIADENSADVISNGVYRKNVAVEEALDCPVSMRYENIGWDSRQEMYDTIANGVNTNNHAYDVVTGYSVVPPMLVINGYMQRMETLDYIDFTKTWWASKLMEELTVGGRVYLASGDASLGLFEALYVMFFNQNMVINYHMEDPYDLVLNGTWTLEKLDEIMKIFDGGEIPALEINHATQASAFISSLGIHITELNTDGDPEFVFGTQSAIDKTDALQAVLRSDAFKVDTEWRNHFVSQASFSTICDMKFARTVRTQNITFDWGCVPLPKYDEKSEYRVWAATNIALFCIPRDALSGTDSAIFLEEYSAQSNAITTPRYYEVALKVQFSPDETTAEIFDIIRTGVDFQFGAVFANEFQPKNPYSCWRSTAVSKTATWESVYDQYESGWHTSLTEMITTIKSFPQ